MRWRRTLFTVVPSIALIAGATNEWLHGIYLSSSEMTDIDGRSSPDWDYGPAFYALATYNYAWVLGAVIASVLGYRLARPDFKALFGGLIGITLFPVVFNAAYLFLGFTLFGSDPTPFALVLMLSAYAWMLINNRMLSVETVGERNVFYSSPVPIAVLDKRGELASVNVTAREILDGPNKGDFQKVLAEIASALTTRGRIDKDVLSSVGERIYSPKYLTIQNPINNRRPILGWSVTFVDITMEEQTARSLCEAKEHAEEASRLQAEFLSIVSHELRTPLTSIRATVDLIASGKLGTVPSGVDRAIAIAKRNSYRLSELIDDLLDLQKLEAGQMEMTLEPIDIIQVVETYVEDMQSYADTRQIGLKFTTAASSLAVYSDPARLGQVIMNVISNAVKFSPVGGEVKIVVERFEKHVEIQVVDCGPGIPAGAENKVFGRFEQVEQSATRAKGGTGLGMNISKLILEQLGGKIFYESKLGQGTAFYVSIPLAQERRSAA